MPLGKAMATNVLLKLKDELSTLLPGVRGVCLVYLFGSQIEGYVGPLSDMTWPYWSTEPLMGVVFRRV